MIDRLNAALEGRYRIERELGEGGMATVYLAEDLKHSRRVAIKVLKPELSAVVGGERFLSEIATTANLQHPHILPLHDSGAVDNFLFYVMPYVEGQTLRDLLTQERQLPVEQAIRIARKVAGALEHAHGKGIVHRDIKPANILITDGEPLVADFGISLAVTEAGGGRMTETGLSLGTPHYMSPEQASGDRTLDRRSDVYALGCVLYEMLTGEPPHGGPTAQSVLAKILTDEVRPARELRRSVPENVEAALQTALEKVTADRFASAREFAAALDDPGYRRPGADLQDESRTTAGGSRLGMAAVAGLVLGVIVAVASSSVWAPSPAQQTVFRAAIDFPDGQALSPLPFGSSLALSPDGETLVYTGPGEGNTGWRLWARRADELRATPLPETSQAVTPTFSPDGQSVAFQVESRVFVRALEGSGPSRQVAENVSELHDWSDDGFLYVSSNTTPFPVLRVPASGGVVEELPWMASTGSSMSLNTWGRGDVLPGGRVGVWERYRSGNITDIEIVGVDLVTGDTTFIAPGRAPTFLESGHLIWMEQDGQGLRAAAFDADRLRLLSDPISLEEAPRANSSSLQGAFSANGDFVYLPELTDAREQQLLWVDRNGNDTPIDPGWGLEPAGGGAWNGTALSGDGTRLVATAGTDDGSQIWMKSLTDDSPPTRITFDRNYNARPQWAPDDESITYISNGGDCTFPCEVWLEPVGGGGGGRLLLSKDREIEEALVSPDGEWIVYRMGGTSTGRDIYAERIDGTGEPIEIATGEANQRTIDLSPDGRWLVYVSNETGGDELFVVPFPDVDRGRWQISEDGGLNARWSRDGTEVFYTDLSGMLTSARLSFVDGLVRVLNHESLFALDQIYLDPNHTSFDVGLTGERFLMYSLAAPGAEARLVWVRNWAEALKEQLGGR